MFILELSSFYQRVPGEFRSSTVARGPIDHLNTRILQSTVSGNPLSGVSWAPSHWGRY